MLQICHFCLLFYFKCVFTLLFLLFLDTCSSGKTTLSASGMLLPNTFYEAGLAKRILGSSCKEGQALALVVTVASIVESFLSPNQRDGISQVQIVIK